MLIATRNLGALHASLKSSQASGALPQVLKVMGSLEVHYLKDEAGVLIEHIQQSSTSSARNRSHPH